jgi:lipoyl(octanoyl) transferase
VTLEVRRLGRIDYEPARALQHDLVRRRAAGEIPDVLLLCEHPAVVTLGRGTNPADVLDRRFPIVEIERGGEATYHGPGQLVGYLIRLLPPGARDLRAHLRLLEDALIDSLAAFSVVGKRVEGATGVWTRFGGRDRKLASIGVAARNWVTYHGFALNLTTDLSAFAALNPCGFSADVMTSLAELRSPAPEPDAVAAEVERALRGRLAPTSA